MFHPIGHQPPSVYWRRRLLLFASLILLVLLLVLTANAILSGGSGTPAAAGTTSRSHTSPAPTTPVSSSRPASSPARASTAPASSRTGSLSSGASSAAAPPCVVPSLRLVAVPEKSSYQIGDEPVLQLQVTNMGTKPCVQDLADPQVELKVYNGESRVWGSHDCKTIPGTSPRTLLPNVPVLVAITWSGLSSESPCTGTRQRVGVGTYTLYASLSGRTGKAGRFTIS